MLTVKDITDVVMAAHDPYATHITAARVEDARFMLAAGDDLSRVASRVGMTVNALMQALERAKPPKTKNTASPQR